MNTPSIESSLKQGALFASRYSIQRLIGMGGMGEVYLALDTLLNNEPVALKIIHEDLSQEERNVKRFQREIQLTRKIAHSNIARTFDAGISEGRFFFSMEYLEGTVISDLLKQGVVPYYEACRIIQQVCEGLDAIHGEGIVHRDLKPGNLILLSNGTVKITDFGIARPGNSDLTKSSEVLGSAPYMAPELWTGTEVGAASDVYALGALFYEMLTGVLPLDGDTAAELMFKHLEVMPPRPSSVESSVPLWVDKIVLKLLSKRPTDRYKNGREVAEEIERELSRAPAKDQIDVTPTPEIEREKLRIVGFTQHATLTESVVEKDDKSNNEKAVGTFTQFALLTAARCIFGVFFISMIFAIEKTLLAPYLSDILVTARNAEFRYLRVFVSIAMMISTGMVISTPLYFSLSPIGTFTRSLAGYLTVTTRITIATGLFLVANIGLYLFYYRFDLNVFKTGMGPELLVLVQRVLSYVSEVFLLVPVTNMSTFANEARQLMIGLPTVWCILAAISMKLIFIVVCPITMNFWTMKMGYFVRWRMQFALIATLILALLIESMLLINADAGNASIYTLFNIGGVRVNLTYSQIFCSLINWTIVLAFSTYSAFCYSRRPESLPQLSTK